MHFVSTGDKFPYSYYMGIMSADKCGEVKLWYTKKPNSEYFDRIIRKVPSQKIESADFPTFNNRNPHWNKVSEFDYFVWEIVSIYGGSVMGLDSITIRPFHDLMNGKEILVGRDAEPDKWPLSFCMHGATAKKDSNIAWRIHELSERALRGMEIPGKHRAFDNGLLRFGGAGIIPFLNVVLEYQDSISIADFGVLGGYRHDGSPFYLWQRDGELINKDCRTIPFYSTWQANNAEITPENVKGTLLGRLIESIHGI